MKFCWEEPDLNPQLLTDTGDTDKCGERVPVSPQPSVDRLSVTWAEPEHSLSSASTRINLYHMGGEPPHCKDARSPPASEPTGEGSEDEEYSATMSAFMCRRESTRRSRKARVRRPSSPFLADADPFPSHRRCSMITTSSADTAASMEEGHPPAVAQEQLVENIRLHKEFIGEVKQERLSMRKKLKLVHQAKAYIKRHEGQLQERLAQSKSTRDIMAKCNILLAAKWQHVKREAANMSNIMIPWELRIKEIESHFGSVVASYFTFLRWLFWVNLIISVMLVVFVIVPEMLTANVEEAGERKIIYEQDKNSSTNLLTLWEFEGVLKCSPIFYGYYTNVDYGDYRLPLAYFMTGLAVYVYSFVATLRKMAENSRMSKLSEKEDECIFSWKLFTGWDFMIGNAETAHNRTASIILSFKEALLEEEEKKKDPRNWRILSLRVLVNVCVLILLAISAFAVVKVVERSNESSSHWWRQNEITIVMSLISNTFPIAFEVLGMLEHYHPRRQLRIQLGRIMVLNLLNIYSLIFALFSKIDGMTTQLENLKPKENSTFINETQHIPLMEMSGLFVFLYENETHACYGLAMDCKRCEINFATPKSDLGGNDILSANMLKVLTMQNTTAFSITPVSSTPTSRLNLLNSYNNDIPRDDPRAHKEYNEKYFSTDQFSSTMAHINDDDDNFISQQKTTQFYYTSTWLPTNYDIKKYFDYITNLAKNRNESESEDNLDDNDDDYNTVDTSFADENAQIITAFRTQSEDKNDTESVINPDIIPETELITNAENDHQDVSVSINTTFMTTMSSDTFFYPNTSNETFSIDITKIYDDEFTTTAGNIVTSINNESELIETITSPTSTGLDTFFSAQSTELEKTEMFNDFTEKSIQFPNEPSTNDYTSLSKDFETSKINLDTVRTTMIESVTKSTAHINTENTRKPTLGNDYESNFSTNIFTTVNTPHVLHQNMTDNKISICYELKCVDKSSYIAKANASTMSINQTKDLIIESNQNHLRYNLSMKTKKQLLGLCWETMFGQELVKLTMMDLMLCILGTLFVDFFRAVFVRYMNKCWCWNMEKKFPQYGDFKIAENILHLVNNQGMVWMGLFFSPGLAVLNLVKLVIMMYLRSWAVMTCNVPHEVVFRASRSNNFYLGLLLVMLFLCVLPVGYAIVWVRPSWHCGPFSDYQRIYHIFTSNLDRILPDKAKKISDYMASPGIVIPLLVLLILVIYYLTSLTNSLREANNDLKTQLRRERTEERRKMFQLADRRRRVGSAEMENTAFSKWKKILPILPPGKSIDSDERRDSNDKESKEPIKKKGDIFAKIVNMALRRPVIEEKVSDGKTLDIPNGDDETDTEFHESLPEDVLKSKNIQLLPKTEFSKKKPNVEFVTTEDGKIKEEIASPSLRFKKKALSLKSNKYIDIKDASASNGEETKTSAVKAQPERRLQIKIKNKDLITSSLIEESKIKIEVDEGLIDKEDDYVQICKKIKNKQTSESSSQSKQSDSIGAVIPVITISKTESDDDMLRGDKPLDSTFNREIEEKIKIKETYRPTVIISSGQAGTAKSTKKDFVNLKALRRQSSVDSINEPNSGKENKRDDGHKFQYSL